MDSRVNAKALVRLMSRAARHFSSVSSASEPVTPIPAFMTTPSSPPKCRIAVATVERTTLESD